MPVPQRIIAVLGATGIQGGGVARDLLKDGEFAVRAVTRNAESDAANELNSLGAEITVADLSDKASLTKAFEGVYGVFGLTVWEPFFRNKCAQKETELEETQHGKNIVDAAKAAGVNHLVWSTLERIKGVHCYHFEGKANVDDYLKASGVPYTSLTTSFYYQLLREQPDGSFLLDYGLPADAKVHLYDGASNGDWVLPILKNPAKYLNTDVLACAEFADMNHLAVAIAEASGKKVVAKQYTMEEFNSDAHVKAVSHELWLK
ncbi:NAD(P)-binding protein [Clavulina sp. PMI_390]|nr:NAD(P)-binding protein [Clavulina sp. PMI_390]